MELVNPDQLQTWITECGPGLGLGINPRSLAPCWAQHPPVIHELTGLYLAWTALHDAFEPPDAGDDLAQYAIPAPRDWLDLTNVSVPAVERVIKSTTTCARAGHHIGGTRSE